MRHRLLRGIDFKQGESRNPSGQVHASISPWKVLLQGRKQEPRPGPAELCSHPRTSSQPNPEAAPSSPAGCPALDCLQDFEPKLRCDGRGTREQGSLKTTPILRQPGPSKEGHSKGPSLWERPKFLAPHGLVGFSATFPVGPINHTQRCLRSQLASLPSGSLRALEGKSETVLETHHNALCVRPAGMGEALQSPRF